MENAFSDTELESRSPGGPRHRTSPLSGGAGVEHSLTVDDGPNYFHRIEILGERVPVQHDKVREAPGLQNPAFRSCTGRLCGRLV